MAILHLKYLCRYRLFVEFVRISDVLLVQFNAGALLVLPDNATVHRPAANDADIRTRAARGFRVQWIVIRYLGS